MKTFSVTEALIYLNEVFPDSAPKNEETLRRAIRNGELTAERNLGREGNRIHESDLIEFAKKYQLKEFLRNNKANTRFSSIALNPVGISEKEMLTVADILRKHMNSKEKDKNLYKIELMEARKQWEEKQNILLNKIRPLQNELSVTENELKLFHDEISKL